MTSLSMGGRSKSKILSISLKLTGVAPDSYEFGRRATSCADPLVELPSHVSRTVLKAFAYRPRASVLPTDYRASSCSGTGTGAAPPFTLTLTRPRFGCSSLNRTISV
jgi:hypothetical protein